MKDDLDKPQNVNKSMEKALKTVYNTPKLKTSLLLISHTSVILSSIILLRIILLLWTREPLAIPEIILTLGIPFVIVSLLRYFINAPRPYELYDFFEAPPKSKRGRSFPSRHAYSAFAIGTVSFFILPWWVGLILIIAAAGLCIARVLLGIHFIRDVLAGAISGVAAALIGALIFNF